MGQAARVTSIEALGEFKAALCSFCEETREALSALEMEIRRTLDWVQHDQYRYWQRQVTIRQDEVAQAKNDFFRRQISAVKPDIIEQRDALREAKYRLEEAEDKVAKCRQWGRLLPRSIEEYEGPARQLAFMVEGDPPAIVALMDRIIASLDSYVGVGVPSGGGSSRNAASAEVGPPPAGAEVAKPVAGPPA